MLSPLIEQLIKALTCLPGVGPKSAQRMAIHLLERDRSGGLRLSEAITKALETVGHCQKCRNFSEDPVCQTCSNPQRDQGLLCVVENPADMLAIEQAGMYRGLYFVLMGHLSPIDGLGPEEIGIPLLAQRLDEEALEEVILATGTTVEGEATAHFIHELASARGVKASRIAHGVPVGGELEFVDSNTIGLALNGRRTLT